MNTLSTLDITKKILDEVARTFLNKGYFSPPDVSQYDMRLRDLLIPEPTLRKLARSLAREYKRPFIEIDKHGKWTWPNPIRPGDRPTWIQKGIRVFMPKQKQLAPLVIPLVQAGFQEGHFKSRFCYYVDDEEFASTYLQLFETSPVFRSILKLPA